MELNERVLEILFERKEKKLRSKVTKIMKKMGVYVAAGGAAVAAAIALSAAETFGSESGSDLYAFVKKKVQKYMKRKKS